MHYCMIILTFADTPYLFVALIGCRIWINRRSWLSCCCYDCWDSPLGWGLFLFLCVVLFVFYQHIDAHDLSHTDSPFVQQVYEA